MAKIIKKAQVGKTSKPVYTSPYGKKTADSTGYFVAKLNDIASANNNLAKAGVSDKDRAGYERDENQAARDAIRQGHKGKPGFDANGFPIIKQKRGGKTTKAKTGTKVKVKAKDGKWIQKAVNPKHKGFCTPMTKATCTPKRKALAKTFKAMGRARKGK